MQSILVVGVYLADRVHNARTLIEAVGVTTEYTVSQRWIALTLTGEGKTDLPHTVAVVANPVPKFELLDRITADAGEFDWIVILDDDIELEAGFLSDLVTSAMRYDFALCQPARTPDSEIEHAITQVQPGLAARRTRFVEIGPCLCLRRDAVPHILPFGDQAGMGWGLDLVWPVRIEAAGLRMGVLDEVTVTHRMRKRGSTYDDRLAWDGMKALFQATPHLAFEEAFTVLEAWPAGAPGPRAVPMPVPSTRRNAAPPVSIIISTDGRCQALRNTLRSLDYLDYPNFEVCVVAGPTDNGTHALLDSYAGRIKRADCPERNLSRSRNLGIALAASEILAFIDDDAVPEPDWLRELVAGYDDPRVAATGGIVFDHTGLKPQYLYTTANRLGNADWELDAPNPELNRPLSDSFPYLQGTNTSFRRGQLIAIGGFDEEIEFYLDETDVCCRLVDAGYLIRQLPNAPVHHYVLPSGIRNEHRITADRYAVMKNKIYFSLVNNHGHHATSTAIGDAVQFIEGHRVDVAHHAEAGRLAPDDAARFERDAERAWQRGLSVGLPRARRFMARALFAATPPVFLRYPAARALTSRKIHLFLGSADRPPARAVNQAAAGHHVHVVLPVAEAESLTFEDGLWLHRVRTREPGVFGLVDVPKLSGVLDRIGAHRQIGWIDPALSVASLPRLVITQGDLLAGRTGSKHAGLSEEEVTWAYRMILGREPEASAITHHMGLPDWKTLRLGLLQSAEFRDRFAQLANPPHS